MTKEYLQISMDMETGEAELTKGSIERLETLITHEPLFAADVLKDMLFELETRYNRSVSRIFPKAGESNAETLQ